MFDFAMHHSDTTTWKHTIEINKTDPASFANNWTRGTHHRLGGPFQGRVPGNRIWDLADLPALQALRPVAAHNVRRVPAAPTKATEEEAMGFYGNYVENVTVDKVPDDLVHIGEPIQTTQWCSAMSQVYRVGALPALPRQYS